MKKLSQEDKDSLMLMVACICTNDDPEEREGAKRCIMEILEPPEGELVTLIDKDNPEDGGWSREDYVVSAATIAFDLLVEKIQKENPNNLILLPSITREFSVEGTLYNMRIGLALYQDSDGT